MKPHWLPDKLTIEDIVSYWSEKDIRQARILLEEIRQDCIDGRLPCQGDPKPSQRKLLKYSPFMRRHFEETINKNGLDAKIHRKDFEIWLREKGAWPLPKDIPLSSWYDTPDDTIAEEADKKDNTTKTQLMWQAVNIEASKLIKADPEITLTQIAESDEVNAVLIKWRPGKLYDTETITKHLPKGLTQKGRRKSR
jgi:hypothetical protein